MKGSFEILRDQRSLPADRWGTPEYERIAIVDMYGARRDLFAAAAVITASAVR